MGEILIDQDYMAGLAGQAASWPTPTVRIEAVADLLEAQNPAFNRNRFIKRAVKAWKVKHNRENIHDEIPW